MFAGLVNEFAKLFKFKTLQKVSESRVVSDFYHWKKLQDLIEATDLYFGQLQLIEDPSNIVQLHVQLVPNFAVRLLEVHRHRVLKVDDGLTAHAPRNVRHYHEDVTEAKSEPNEEKELVEYLKGTVTILICLTWEEVILVMLNWLYMALI